MTTDAGEEYLTTMAALARAQQEYQAEQDRVHARYAARLRAAAEAVDEAEQEHVAAVSALRHARALVDQVNLHAEVVWHGVVDDVPTRHPAHAAGLPAPVDVDLGTDRDILADLDAVARSSGALRPRVGAGGPAVAGEPAVGPATAVSVLLKRAEELIDQYRSRSSPTAVEYGLLLVLGAAGALVGYAAARGLIGLGRSFDSSPGAVLTVLGQVLALLSPAVGLVGITWLTERRAVRIGVGAVLTVLAAGLLTVAAAVAVRSVTGWY